MPVLSCWISDTVMAVKDMDTFSADTQNTWMSPCSSIHLFKVITMRKVDLTSSCAAWLKGPVEAGSLRSSFLTSCFYTLLKLCWRPPADWLHLSVGTFLKQEAVAVGRLYSCQTASKWSVQWGESKLHKDHSCTASNAKLQISCCL